MFQGRPLYVQRYDQVQSFHFPPGYAPVKIRRQAFFINQQGEPVFDRRFNEAFGFYHGIATVCDADGFFHIDEQGTDVHQQRFAWSGNFQEGLCAVQEIDSGLYFHIDSYGHRPYTQSYAYVGDFRYGIAVVLNHEGSKTHIDRQGRLIHGQLFPQLDVYHKGYAIAGDGRGYFHIDKRGRALYAMRFSKLEPFYNGRAVAVDRFGVVKLISDTGDVISTLDSRVGAANKITQHYVGLAFSYWESRILASLLALGVFEVFVSEADQEQLAVQLELDSVVSLMIIRWMLLQQLILRVGNNYILNDVGKLILHQLKPVFAYWQSQVIVENSLQLTKTLKHHQSDFDQRYGCGFFEYLQQNPELAGNLSEVMSFYAADYQQHITCLKLMRETVCDVGGGNGALLMAIQAQYPDIKPIILDKFHYPHTRPFIFKQQDFFQPWEVEADVFIVSRVLHDWNDDRALQILRNVANNMTRKTVVYVFETLLDESGGIDKGVTVSFHLMSLLGGRERTLAEYRALFRKAGLKIMDVYLPEDTVSLIKAIKR